MRPCFSEIIKSLIVLPLEKHYIQIYRKYDLNNREYDTFQEIILSLLYVEIKNISDQISKFCDKETSKALMQRTRVRNIYLKQRTEAIKIAYNQQRKKCVSILKKSKRPYFESLDVKFVKDNNKI